MTVPTTTHTRNTSKLSRGENRGRWGRGAERRNGVLLISRSLLYPLPSYLSSPISQTTEWHLRMAHRRQTHTAHQLKMTWRAKHFYTHNPSSPHSIVKANLEIQIYTSHGQQKAVAKRDTGTCIPCISSNKGRNFCIALEDTKVSPLTISNSLNLLFLQPTSSSHSEFGHSCS